MDRLSAMEAFVAVVETGGFSTAATRLGLSKGVIAKRVMALEESVGARLFHRTTRKIQVTRSGQLFYRHSVSMLADFYRASEDVRDEVEKLEGEIRINAPMSLGANCLMPGIADFIGKHPDVKIDLSLSDHFVDVVGDGYDLVLRIDEMESSSMVARSLKKIRRVVCASPAYIEQHGAPLLPADLRKHNILHYCLQRSGARWHFSGNGKAEYVDVSFNFTANNGMALAAAASCGMGIVLLPEFIVAPAIARGELLPLLNDYQTPPLTLHALWYENTYMPARIRALIDHLVVFFAGCEEVR